MKIYFFFLVFVSSLYSSVAIEVKKADVLISINGQELAVKKGEHKELADGVTLCYEGGDGKVVIKKLKKQLKKEGRCLLVPVDKSQATTYIADMKHKMVVAFWDGTQSVSHGAGTKGVRTYNNEGSFVLTPKQKELVIYSEEFGPLPVTLIIKDKQGQEVMRFENDESEITLIHIDKKRLQTGMTLTVFNGFDEPILKKAIIVEGK